MGEPSSFVEIDVSVLDWHPTCESCKQVIPDWSEAVGLPGALVEDDEPTFMLFIHRECPEPGVRDV